MKHSILGSAYAAILVAASSVAHAVSVSSQGTWETTLQGRDLDGDLSTFEAYYDTVLNITWLANANYGAGSGYDNGISKTDGRMSWSAVSTWIATLNPYNSGITGWRLPITNPIDGTTQDDETFSNNGSEDYGYNVSAPGTLYAGSTASEMAHLFYNTLGNKGYCDPITSTVSTCRPQAGWGLTNTGPFFYIKEYKYWSATSYTRAGNSAWVFNFNSGRQIYDDKGYTYNAIYDPHAWAVHDGDVGVAAISAVPIPAAAWLFGSGLLGLVAVGRR